MERPTGVTVFGILLIVFSSFTLITMVLSTLFIAFASSAIGMDTILAGTGGNLTYFIITVVVSFLIAFGGLFSGITLLMMKRWARQFVLGFAICVVAFGILNIIILIILDAQIWGQLISFPIGLVFYGLIFWYFTQKHIKRAFFEVR
ncbi:hypothetical protein ACFL6I_13795 [candidate division KSB1 bacterium]